MADDRHVTRTGEDYAIAMQALLPQGQAWPRAWDEMLMLVVRGLTRIWGDFETLASLLLERESDPRFTFPPQGDQPGLLPDWERNWGLPDPCYSAPQTIAERQQALIMRMTMLGAQSREFFVAVAAQLGYAITITEYRPFTVAMDGCGDCRTIGDGTLMTNPWGQVITDPAGGSLDAGEMSAWPNYGIGPLANRYYWTVHVDQAKLVWFRVTSGQVGVDPHLRIGIADDLECLLNRWKPAHTEIVFDYSGLQTGGDMAGTP